MRNLLWTIAALFVVFVAPAAQAHEDDHEDDIINYKIVFMGPPETLFPTSGNIIYDYTQGTTDPFIEFTVTWDGEFFDFTTVANDYTRAGWGTSIPGYFNIPTSAGCTGPTGVQPEIVVLTTCTSDAIWAAEADITTNVADFAIEYNGNFVFPYYVDLLGGSMMPPPEFSARPGFSGNGGLPLSINPQPNDVPEPSTSVLLLVGIGLTLVIRKHAGIGLPQAS